MQLSKHKVAKTRSQNLKVDNWITSLLSDATPISAHEFREGVISIRYLLRINTDC